MSELPAAQKRNPFHRPMIASPALSRIVGLEPISRPQVIKKIWAHIRRHDLQDKKNRRMINADDLLLRIFDQPQVSMFQMTKLVNQHLHPMEEETGAGV